MKFGSILEFALFLLVIAAPIAGAENATEKIWYVSPEWPPARVYLRKCARRSRKIRRKTTPYFTAG